MEEDEDLHNKLKSSDQANISDEQDFNTDNKHFREKCKSELCHHRRDWNVGEGHRSKSKLSDATANRGTEKNSWRNIEKPTRQ